MATQSIAGSASAADSSAPRFPLAVIIALLATYLIWGTTYLAMKYGLLTFPPLLMTGLRFLGAGIILLVYLRWRGTPLPSRGAARNAAFVGICLAGGMGGSASAAQYIDTGLIAVSIASTPIWSAIFAGLWGQWPTRREWAGILIGFAGVAVLGFNGINTPNMLLGILITQLGVVSWSFGSVWSRRQQIPPGAVGFSVEMLSGGVALMVFGLLRGEWFSKPLVIEALVAWLYLVIFGSVVAFSSYMYLLRKVKPALATSYAYVNPVIALIVGAVIASEQITVAGVAAMVLILTGLAIMARSSSSKPV